MSETIKFLKDMQSSLKSSFYGMVISIAGIVVVAIAAVLLVCVHDERNNQKIYLVDQGSAIAAVRASNGVQRDLEVINHVTRFHELMYSMAPDAQSIENNHELFSHLADNSAERYYQDLAEQNFFKRLVQTNSMENIVVDSVKVNVRVYPYRAVTYGRLYMVRESSITVFNIQTSCQLTETTRTQYNPNGLMIERFNVDVNERIETRARR